MRPFELVQTTEVPQALGKASEDGVRFVAGGTTLIDLMKLNVETPRRLIDINRLPLNQISTGCRNQGGSSRKECRSGQSSSYREPVPGIIAGVAGGGIRPAAQHGDHRREPAATNPMRLFS